MSPMNPRLLRPRQTGFDPRSIANLTGWFDASDSTSYTELSGQVSEWRDKSGSGNHISQSTANNRPTLFESASDTQSATRSAIGGKQALFFDGVNDRLLTTATVTSGQARTVFAVADRINNAATGTACSFGNTTTGASAIRWLCRYGTASELAVSGDSAGVNITVSSVLAWDSPNISCWSQASATRNTSYFLNGTQYTVTGNPVNAQVSFGGLLVGALALNFGSGIIQFMNGAIGEILIYNRELSEAERTAATRGLANKWGISLA